MSRSLNKVMLIGNLGADPEVRSTNNGSRVATLRGGGLSSTKTVSAGGLAGDWATSSGDDQAAVAQIAQASQARAEHMLWKAWPPAVLALGAAFLAVSALRTNRTSTGNEGTQQHHGEAPQRDQIAVS